MVRSLRLVAIRPGEIVLKGQTGFWTLPLATLRAMPRRRMVGDEWVSGDGVTG